MFWQVRNSLRRNPRNLVNCFSSALHPVAINCRKTNCVAGELPRGGRSQQGFRLTVRPSSAFYCFFPRSLSLSLFPKKSCLLIHKPKTDSAAAAAAALQK